jgi:hypothetical protein
MSPPELPAAFTTWIEGLHQRGLTAHQLPRRKRRLWPNDCINWARLLHPQAYGLAVRVLRNRNADPRFQVEVPNLAHQARHAAFELARLHLPLADCFADFNAFRYWILAVVPRQAMRFYLLHPLTQPRLNVLPLPDRRLLGLAYVDGLADSEVATLLGIRAGEVRPRVNRLLATIRGCPLPSRPAPDDRKMP